MDEGIGAKGVITAGVAGLVGQSGQHVGFLAAVLGLVIIDLVLSGDNAIVIGMAVRTLPPRRQRVAVLFGGGAALVLRVLLTPLVSFLTQVPLLKLAGGLVLVWITYRLLAPSEESGAADERAVEASFWVAMRTIIIADVTMSTDNVLAVGAAAHGDVVLLMFGLTLSMAIIMVGGTIAASLMDRLPWLPYAGGLILLYLAGDMVATDPVIAPLHGGAAWPGWLLMGVFTLLVGALLYRRGRRTPVRGDAGLAKPAMPAAGRPADPAPPDGTKSRPSAGLTPAAAGRPLPLKAGSEASDAVAPRPRIPDP